MNFRVRPYELNDLTAIAEIEKQCFESPWTYSAFCMEYADKNKHYFVAEADNGEIIGYGGFAHVIDGGFCHTVGVITKSKAAERSRSNVGSQRP